MSYYLWILCYIDIYREWFGNLTVSQRQVEVEAWYIYTCKLS